MAIPCSNRIEILGSYKFNKTKTRIGHGSDDIFRLDAFAAGLLYKPFRIQVGEPFVGVGLNYYHFVDNGKGDIFTHFILPLKSALGPYIQVGSYFRFNSRLKIQVFLKYNLVRRTVKRTTDWGTYHYQTDFSGLEFGIGILFCIHGKGVLGTS